MTDSKPCSCCWRQSLGRNIAIVVHRSGEDWYFALWLRVDKSTAYRLYRGVHRGFDDFLALAEMQGRLDDLEERALLEEQDRLEGGG